MRAIFVDANPSLAAVTEKLLRPDDMPVAINHIAITMPNREAWLKQLAWLRKNGVKFQRRVNHGMTHSLYISDPNGYGVEVLYELPREIWGENIQAGLDCSDADDQEA